jgi:thiamine-monophosphate kinase
LTDSSPNTTEGTGTVSSAGERALIERIRARAAGTSASAPWLTQGIGDDAAVMAIPRGEVLVSSVDALVEDVHFRLDWSTPHSVGRKAIAVSLSDLAAMGAAPRAVLVSLTLPAGFALADFDALVDGLVEEAGRHGATLAGGNIASSPGSLAIHVTSLGSAHPRRILTRAGGRPGDELFVTGTIGAATAALGVLRHEGPGGARASADLAECLARYETPSPLLRCGRRVAGQRAASACMDLSDGLADAARQIAQASGTGACLDAALLPVHPAARRWFEARGLDPIAAALGGGEDYELLFAVPRRRRRGFLAAIARSGGIVATLVGELTTEPALVLRRDDHNLVLPAGYSHLG